MSVRFYEDLYLVILVKLISGLQTFEPDFLGISKTWRFLSAILFYLQVFKIPRKSGSKFAVLN